MPGIVAMNCSRVPSVLGAVCLIVCVALLGVYYASNNRSEGPTMVQISVYDLSLGDYRNSVEGINYEGISPVHLTSSNVIQPTLYPLGQLLEGWSPSDISPSKWLKSVAHPTHGNGLPRFDYSSAAHRTAATLYRDAELPFVMYNVAPLNEAASKHFTTTNLLHTMGETKLPVARSATSKFTYYATKKDIEHTKRTYSAWEPPQSALHMEFSEFVRRVQQAENPVQTTGTTGPYYYLTLTYTPQNPTHYVWIREALPMFSPKPSSTGDPLATIDEPSFFSNQTLYRGILCRFGSKGMSSAAHFDGQRNFVAMVRGRRRYILLPPDECKNLELYPRSHPSARHSRVDWSNITVVKQHPALYKARATEVVLSMGEILYIPANWFHYIVHQDASIQCNSRSGTTTTGDKDIARCGFRRKNQPL